MNIWQVLVSSPSDVSEERESLSRVVETVNLALEAGGKPIRLQLRKWETDVPPGLHKLGGQGQVESKLHFGDCDILIGIFWKRFGTPVLGSLSGTEREILQGRDGWRSKNHPKVMVFFSTAPPPTRTLEELEQLRKVIEFKEMLKREGLIREYSDPHDFERMVTRYLLIECFGSNEAERYLRSSLLCRIESSTLEVRAEGRTERVGDLRLFFGPRQPEAPPETPDPILVDIDVHLNITIVWHSEGTRPILVLDVLGQPTQQWAGRRIAPNIVRFESVPIPISSPTKVIITNLRADALGLAIAMASYGSTIAGSVRARDGFRDVDIVNETVTLAFLHGGSSLAFQTEPPRPMKIARTGITAGLAGTDGLNTASATFAVLFAESFPGFFKNRAEEAGITTLPPEQVANCGTRIMLMLTSLPDGIAVYVAEHDHGENENGPMVRLVQTQHDELLVPGEQSKIFPANSRGLELVRLSVTDRSAVAVWEWVSTAPVLLHSKREVRIDILLAAESDVVPGTGTVYAAATLAPVSLEKVGDSLPVPCFGMVTSAFALLSIE